MCVVQNFEQLEVALRQEAKEVLVIGKLAHTLKNALEKKNFGLSNNVLDISLIKKIERSYTIWSRKATYYVPFVLQQKRSQLKCKYSTVSGNGENCGR